MYPDRRIKIILGYSVYQTKTVHFKRKRKALFKVFKGIDKKRNVVKYLIQKDNVEETYRKIGQKINIRPTESC